MPKRHTQKKIFESGVQVAAPFDVSNLHNSSGNFRTGEWTPQYFVAGGITAVVLRNGSKAFYIQFGNMILAFVSLTVSYNTAGLQSFDMSLPIAPTTPFATYHRVIGSMSTDSPDWASGYVISRDTADRSIVSMRLTAGSSIAMNLVFQYTLD